MEALEIVAELSRQFKRFFFPEWPADRKLANDASTGEGLG